MNKDEQIAAALFGVAAGLIVGSTVMYIAAKKDMKNLERRLHQAHAWRKTTNAWLAKAVSELPEDKAQQVIKEMVSDVKFHIITDPLEK